MRIRREIFMPETVNLQIIIDTVAFMLTLSVPFAFFLGMSARIVNFFFSMVFGDRNIKL